MSNLGDSVVETANGPGTGTIQLAGKPAGSFVPFSTRFSSGNKVFYAITDENGMREMGVGTFTTGSPNTLSRDTVISNTAGDTSKLNFTLPVLVYNTIPSANAIYQDNANQVNITGSLTVAGGLEVISSALFSGATFTGEVQLEGETVTQAITAFGTMTADQPFLAESGATINGGLIVDTITASGNVSAPNITGHVWHDETSSRVLGTTYTNSNGYSISVMVSVVAGSGVTLMPITIDGVTITAGQTTSAASGTYNTFFQVPSGKTYIVGIGTGGFLTSWFELF